MKPSNSRATSTDRARVTALTITDEEWERAETAHARFQALLETKPRAKALFDSVLAEINGRQATLRRLRQARALTQSTVAGLLDMDQSEVSRLERRTDMLLSTLKRFVEATGGEMHIVVSYPDGGPVELLVDNG
ncbi:MAG: helix-turn-helix domain-containing protein [Acidimicrobiia bacterium]|nr:helix-turn-helix domain-containing protein [Acidimicrobiia bacterium]